MRVLILDHFGVMCLADKHGREHSKYDLPNVNEMRIHGDFDNFDKGAIDILNSIIEETNAEIVISSDWKRWCKLEDIKIFYRSQGIIKEPIGYTPNIGVDRNVEINKWISDNFVEKWVAVDDIYLNVSNFVWISRTDEGIKQAGVKENILKYLNI